MTTTLRSPILAQLGWTWRDRAGDLVITDSNHLPLKKDLADGAGPDQADAVWHAIGQVLADGEEMLLDLGALPQSLFGDTITIPMTRVKAILIVNKSAAGDGYLVVG